MRKEQDICSLCYNLFMAVTIPEKYFPLFEQNGILKTYREGENIFTASEKADYVYLVYSGRIRVYSITSAGREITFEVLRKGRLFGDSAFITHAVRRVSICAVTDTVLIQAEPGRMISVLCSHPDLLRLVLEHLSETTNELTHQIIRFTSYDSQMKVADFLLENTSEKSPDLSYTQEDIAVSLSMNRVTVARIMHAFKEKKWIDYSYGLVTVLQRKELKKLLPE